MNKKVTLLTLSLYANIFSIEIELSKHGITPYPSLAIMKIASIEQTEKFSNAEPMNLHTFFVSALGKVLAPWQGKCCLGAENFKRKLYTGLLINCISRRSLLKGRSLD